MKGMSEKETEMVVNIHIPKPQYFEFTLDGIPGVHRLPKPEFLPRHLAMLFQAASEGSQEEQTKKGLEFVNGLFDAFCPELKDDNRLTIAAMMNVFQAWGNSAQGVSLGESPASPVSATSMGEPSTMTY